MTNLPRSGVPQMHRYLAQGGDVNKPNKLGDTPLHEVGLGDSVGVFGVSR